MYYNKVELCGVDTSKLPTLSDAEKSELLGRIAKGDKQARREMIDGNLRLVLSIIGRFSCRGENVNDLFQVGCIGLIKAIDHFNTELDVKFSTYAVPMIIGEVRRYLRDNNAIRVSRSMRDLAYHALAAREHLAKVSSRDPTTEEIVSYLCKNEIPCTVREVVAALEAIIEPISLFEPVYSEGNGGDSLFVMDQIRDEGNTDAKWLEDIALREAIGHLTPREKTIIEMRYYNGKTQMEIAEEIGISQAQVSRLEKGALAHIRRYF